MWKSCLVVVAAVHVAYGFNWLTGLTQLRIRYHQGIASQRPFSDFVRQPGRLADQLSPLLAIAICRSVGLLARSRHAAWVEDRAVALIALSGLLAALVADLSALSKAETKRIWLTFGNRRQLRVSGCSGAAKPCGPWRQRQAGRSSSTTCSTPGGEGPFTSAQNCEHEHGPSTLWAYRIDGESLHPWHDGVRQQARRD